MSLPVAAAFLFDMDGTLISSIEATERVWGAWAASQGLDVSAFLQTIHGVRAIDVIGKLGLPGVDPATEAEKIAQGELADLDGVKPIPGAREFLAKIPATRWAIVTSAPRELAVKRLAAAGMPVPAIFITAEDVRRGKPAPDGYILAAQRLGVDIRNCLVFEDAPAGIKAAEAADAAGVIVVAAAGAAHADHGYVSIVDFGTLEPVNGSHGITLHRIENKLD